MILPKGCILHLCFRSSFLCVPFHPWVIHGWCRRFRHTFLFTIDVGIPKWKALRCLGIPKWKALRCLGILPHRTSRGGQNSLWSGIRFRFPTSLGGRWCRKILHRPPTSSKVPLRRCNVGSTCQHWKQYINTCHRGKSGHSCFNTSVTWWTQGLAFNYMVFKINFREHAWVQLCQSISQRSDLGIGFLQSKDV